MVVYAHIRLVTYRLTQRPTAWHESAMIYRLCLLAIRRRRHFLARTDTRVGRTWTVADQNRS